MWNINTPQGRITCAIFTKFAEFVPRFRMRIAVEISLDLLKRLWSYGDFKLTVSGCPQIFSAPVKLCVRPPTVLEVQERAQGPLSPCQVWFPLFSTNTAISETISSKAPQMW